MAFKSCVMMGITITLQYKNMFIECIPSSLAYNSYTYVHVNVHVNQVWCVHNWHAWMLVKIIVHMSSAYMSVLHKSSYVINLSCTRMHIHEWNEKRVVSKIWCTCVQLSLNWAVSTWSVTMPYLFPLLCYGVQCRTS